jgi:hypothetical protein
VVNHKENTSSKSRRKKKLVINKEDKI